MEVTTDSDSSVGSVKRGRGRPCKTPAVPLILEADQLLMPPPGIDVNELIDVERVNPSDQQQITTDIANRFAHLHEADLADLEMDPWGWFDGETVAAFLASIALRDERPVTVVSPVFSMGSQLHSIAHEDSIRFGPIDYQILLIPIHFGNHWALLIHAEGEMAVFVDSLCKTDTPSRIDTYELPDKRIMRELMLNAIRTWPGKNNADVDIFNAPLNSYNQQNDGYNCGPYTCLFAEAYLTNDGNMLLENLDINVERAHFTPCSFAFKQRQSHFGPACC